MASTVVNRHIFRLGRTVGRFATVKPRNAKFNYTTRSLWNPWRITSSFLARHSSTTSEKTSQIAAQTNWQRRVELATLYRGFEFYNLHEGVDNHVTLMAPAASGEGEVMLVIPRGLHWKEVTPSSLLGVDSNCEVVEGDGEVQIEAATIHKGVHDARQDAVCCVHLHMPYATALGLLENPHFGMYHQNHCRFYKRFAFDRHFGGLSKSFDEGKRIATILGQEKIIAFLCNHGVLLLAQSAPEALENTYFLERSCMHQMLAMSSGQKLHELPDDVAKLTAEQMTQGIESYWQEHFDAVQRLLVAKDPGFLS